MSTQSPQTSTITEALTVTPRRVIAVGAVLPAVTTIVVALRFYVRIVETKSVGFDDSLILFALVLLAWTFFRLMTGLMTSDRFLPSLLESR